MARNQTEALASEDQASVQEEIFRSLLKTPHRQVDESLALHKAQFERDPNFYGHLATWAVVDGNNTVRDLDEVFIAVLFASEYQEHREAAYTMLQKLPPYQVGRVANCFTGWDEVVHHRSFDKKPLPKTGVHGVTVERARYGRKHGQAGKLIPVKKVDLAKNAKLKRELVAKKLVDRTAREFTVTTYKISHEGLGKRCFKGMLKKAVRAYLRLRERKENRGQMEGALIRARDHLHRLYYRSNTLPQGDENGWINRYIFRGETEDGSRLHALQRLIDSKDPTEQSALIMDHKIPYPVAAGLISNMTPSVIVALIDAMSPQELLSNLDSLQRRGAMKNADLKALIEAKLKKAKKARRVDAMKGGVAAKAVKNLDADVRKAVTEVTDAQLKKLTPINCRVALLIDKSGSMEKAIELGKELAAAIAQACERHEPLVYMFDSKPTRIQWRTADGDITQKSAWDNKLKMFRANGGTSPGTAIRAMMDHKPNPIVVDEVIVVTDEGENASGVSFATMLKNYEKRIGLLPFVAIVRVASPYGTDNRMTRNCEAMGIEVDSIDCTNIDQISMPNLIQRLARQSMFELVQEVLERELPTRAAWDQANKMTPAEIRKGAAAVVVA
jgi:uncharacterized protein with von Willebrand factor type A (vWA) domain